MWDYDEYNEDVLKDPGVKGKARRYDERTIDQLLMDCI